jgi:beta-lactamase regulating signal transducer with metallopeptidase domain
MNSLSDLLVDAGVWLLEANLKSAVALVCVAAVCCLPRSWLSARWRSGLWLLALLPLVLPIELPSPTSAWNLISRLPVSQPRVELSNSNRDDVELARLTVQELDYAAEAANAGSTTPAASNTFPRITWRTVLVTIWLTVALVLLGRLAWLTIQLRRWIATRPALSDPDVLQIANGCIPEAGLGRVPRIVDSGDDVGPAIAGWLRPVLLFPRDRLRNASTDRLWFILLHEFRHVAAGDTWIIAGLHVLCAINWFNPLVWLARRQWIEEREIACDTWVLAQTGRDSRLDYADMLFWLSSSQKLPAPLLLSAGMISFSTLLERRVLAMRHMKSTWRSMLAGSAAVLSIVAVALTDRVPAAPPASDQKELVAPVKIATAPAAAPAPVAAPIDLKKPRHPYVVVARHAILWNGIWPITIEELKSRLETMRKDGPVTPNIRSSIGVQFPDEVNGNPDLPAVKRDPRTVMKEVMAAVGGEDQVYAWNFIGRRGSRGVDRVKTVEDLKPNPDRLFTGRVVNPNGDPAVGAYITIIPKDAFPENLYVSNGELSRAYDEWWALSNERGEFRVDPLCDEYRVAIVQKSGFAFLDSPPRSGGVYELQPWGEVTLKAPEGWNENDFIDMWSTPTIGEKRWPSIMFGSLHRDQKEVTVKAPTGAGKLLYGVSDREGMGGMATKMRFEFEVATPQSSRGKPTIVTPPPLDPKEREEAIATLRKR